VSNTPENYVHEFFKKSEEELLDTAVLCAFQAQEYYYENENEDIDEEEFMLRTRYAIVAMIKHGSVKRY
jgi:hypothetical protein